MTNLKSSSQPMSPQELTESFSCITDGRGSLCVAQRSLFNKPFEIKRVFWIYNVPEHAVRGQHANRNCMELLVAVCGSVKISLTDGRSSCDFVLDHPSKGLYIPPMVWCKLQDFSKDCVCVCMANQDYDEQFYINDYNTFIEQVKNADLSL